MNRVPAAAMNPAPIPPSDSMRPGDSATPNRSATPIAALVRLTAVASLALAAVLTTPLCVTTARGEQWTDLRGTRTIQARMVGHWGDSIVLEMSDGKRVAVKMDQLRADSRIQAEEIIAQIDRQRSAGVDQIQAAAKLAAAPAPDPLPATPPAPDYVPPAANVSLEAFLTHAREQSANGHALRLLHDALPAKHRDDAEKLFKLLAVKIDPATVDSVGSLLRDAGGTVVGKQNWLFSHPRFEEMSADQVDSIRNFILPAAELLSAVGDSSVMSVQAMSDSTLEQWLTKLDASTSAAMYRLEQNRDDSMDGVELIYGEPKDDVATLTVVRGKAKTTVPWKNIDGRWLPLSIATNWDRTVADLSKQLEAMPAGSLGQGAAAGVIGLLGPMLQPLKSSQDAASFHAAMETLLAQVQPFVGPAIAILQSQAAQVAGGGNNPYAGSGDPYGGNPYGGDPYGGGDPSAGSPYGGDPYGGGDPSGGSPYGGGGPSGGSPYGGGGPN